jgi:hypothetical protein
MGKSTSFDVLATAKAVGFDESSRKINKLANDAEKSAKSIQRQTQETHLLSTAILAGASAAIPVAGVAAGALVGLSASAGVAVLGILGINDAVKQGTPLGLKYKAAFAPVTSEFKELKQVAAAGMFDGINKGIKDSQKLFPTLNRDTALFSAQIGTIAGNVGPGLVALFTRLNPLFESMGTQLTHGSKSFEQWAQSSQSVGKFVAYVQTTLPQVEATVASLITTISHVAIAAEPFGGTTLTAIRLFSTAINAIPIGVLQTLVPLLLGLKIGNTLGASLGNAGIGIEKFGTKLGAGKGIASEASGVFGKLGGVVGKLGPYGIAAGIALGGLSAAMGRGKQAAIEQTKRVNELVEAIQNGTIVTAVWNNALETGAAQATKVGLSQHQITVAISETAVQYQDAQRQLDDYKKTQDSAALAGGQFGASAQQVAARQSEVIAQTSKLKDALAESRKEYEAATKTAADYARQQGSTELAQQVSSRAITQIAAGLGLTTSEYYKATIAANKNTESTKLAAAEMVLENNAAGLLSAALDKLGGNNLGIAQAQTAVASATNAASTALHANGAAIKGNSAKAIANQQALQAAASAALAHGNAVAKQTGSTVKATAAIEADKTAIENQLRSQHKLTPAVQAYIDTIYKIKPVARTKVDADTAAAVTRISNVIGLAKVAARTRRAIIGADTSSAYSKLRALNSYLQSMLHPVIVPVVHSPGTGAGKLIIRDSGGPVTKGQPYLIGLNKRPEIFYPGESGRIAPISAGSKASTVSASGGGTTINLTVNAGLGTDATAVGRQIIGILEKTFAAGETVANGQRAMR